MNTERLQAVAEKSAENLRELIRDFSNEIQDAIIAATEQAQEDEKESVVLTLSHSIKLDIGADKQEDSLAFGVRRKSSIEGKIPDPAQPDLL